MTRLVYSLFVGLQSTQIASCRAAPCDAEKSPKSLILKVHSAVHGGNNGASHWERLLHDPDKARKLLILKVHSAVHLQQRPWRRQKPRPYKQIASRTEARHRDRASVLLETEMT